MSFQMRKLSANIMFWLLTLEVTEKCGIMQSGQHRSVVCHDMEFCSRINTVDAVVTGVLKMLLLKPGVCEEISKRKCFFTSVEAQQNIYITIELRCFIDCCH